MQAIFFLGCAQANAESILSRSIVQAPEQTTWLMLELWDTDRMRDFEESRDRVSHPFTAELLTTDFSDPLLIFDPAGSR